MNWRPADLSSGGRSSVEVRLLSVFDPDREAIVLVAAIRRRAGRPRNKSPYQGKTGAEPLRPRP